VDIESTPNEYHKLIANNKDGKLDPFLNGLVNFVYKRCEKDLLDFRLIVF
jgi:hypothetical protein